MLEGYFISEQTTINSHTLHYLRWVSYTISPWLIVQVTHARIQREGGEAGGPVPPPPQKKNEKNRGFISNTGLDPLKIHKATKSDSECLAIIDTPAKRHLNGVALAGR